MVRAQLSALLRDPPAAPACSEDDRARFDHVLAAARAPTVRRPLELAQRRLRKRRDAGLLDRVAQRRCYRMPCAIADLQQPLASCATAAREPVAAVFARELDTVLLEPVDRRRRFRRQDLDEPTVGRLVRRRPDVASVLLRRIVVAERRLDPAL